MTINRVLLLGHSGYLGSHLERQLCRHPKLEVIGRSKPDVDLCSQDAVYSLAPLCTPRTAIVMCSAIKKQLGDTSETFAQNLEMVRNVSNLIATHSVARLVFFSSTAVYGEDVLNLDTTEQTRVAPTSFYGIGKYTAERLLLRVVSSLSLTSLLVVRPPLVYGPAEPAVFYGPSGFLRMAQSGQQITLWGDGRELREFVYVDDLANVVAALTMGQVSGVVNIVSGASYRFVDALQIIESILGRPADVVSRPRSKQMVDHTFVNTVLSEALPDFRFTTLEQGLRRTAGLA